MSGLHPRRLVPVLLAACVLWAGGANGATDLDDHPYVPSEVILKFKSEAAKSQKAALLTELEATTLRNFHHHGLTQLHLATLSVAEAIHRYSGHPLVEYIEPNYIVTLDLFPDDPDFSLQWGLYNTGQTGGAAGSDIDALEAWDLTTDAEEVVVAIVDSGVDYNHEDLADNIYINPGEIPGNSNDDDGNGFIDDVNGWNFFIDNNNPRDVFGHGTSIAGIIGAVGNNTLGVTGIAWNVKILPVKWTSGASGSLSDALAATEYATMMGVDIMNHSWGDHFVFLPEAMLDVFTDANDAGILLVCAAGNDASNIDRDPHYPAGFDLPNIVSVAASKANDSRAGFSNYGPLSVDLAAPGEDIHSTLLDDLYGLFGVGGPYIPGTGTSFAAPFAAGALALMKSFLPGLTAQEAKARLLETVDPVQALEGVVLTGGRLNVYQALLGPDIIPPAPVTNLVATIVTSTWVNLQWVATGDDLTLGTATAYDLRYATFPITVANFTSATEVDGEPSPAPPGDPEQMRVTGLDFDTTYYFAIKVMDENGNTSGLSNVIDVTTMGPPDVSITPGSFAVQLFSEEMTTQTLIIGNSGIGTLDYEITWSGADWLTAAPDSGFVAPGGDLVVQLTFDAAGLCGPEYTTDIVVTSSDPDTPELLVPVQLQVTGVPVIAAPDTIYDFGSVFVGAVASDTLTVTNIGCMTLEITDIISDHADFEAEPTSFTLAQGASRKVALTFTPGSAATLAATLTVQSNDQLAPEVTLDLSGVGLEPPEIEVVTDSLLIEIDVGGTQERIVSLENVGGSDLVYAVGLEAPAEAFGTVRFSGPVNAAVVRSYGSQFLGDSWDYLNANWHLFGEIEIAIDYTTLDVAPVTYADLAASGADVLIISHAHSANFNWEYSDAELEAIRSYVDLGRGLFVTSGSLNDDSAPNNSHVLAPLLGLSRQETYHWTLFEHSPLIALAPEHPLMRNLFPDYDPTYPYTTYTGSGDWMLAVDGGEVVAMANSHNKSVVAYRNRSYISAYPERSSQTDDYQFIYNAILYGATGLAIWVTADPPSGTVPVGGTAEVAVTVDATRIYGGTYTFDIVLATNDQDETEIRIPCQVRVRGEPQIALSQTAYDFGEVFVGYPASDTLTVFNSGSDSLTVLDIASDDTAFRAEPAGFKVGAGDSRRVALIFDPSDANHFEGTLTLQSDDPNTPTWQISAQGEGQIAPLLSVLPDSLHQTLPADSVVARTLTLANDGGSALEFAIEIINPFDKSSRVLAWGDDLEHGVGSWTTVAYVGQDLWHLTQDAHHSPETSWWCGVPGQGNYDTGYRVLNGIISPPIDISAYEPPMSLEFFEWYETQPDHDNCKVDITTNGGVTWVRLREYASGTSGGWGESVLDIPAYCLGGTIQIRFLFETGNYLQNDYPGWYVDDVKVVINSRIWLSASEMTGVIPAGSSVDLELVYDTTDHDIGYYEMILAIQSNDPAHPAIQVPVTMKVHRVPLTVAVDVSAGPLVDGGNILGADLEASDFFEAAFDAPDHTLSPAGYVAGYFPHPEWDAVVGERFTADIRAAYDPQVAAKIWPFVVETDQTGPVVLTFAPSFAASQGWELWLLDHETGLLQSLLPALRYEYVQPVTGARSFDIILGPQNLPPLTPAVRELTAGWSLVGVPLAPPVGKDSWAEVLGGGGGDSDGGGGSAAGGHGGGDHGGRSHDDDVQLYRFTGEAGYVEIDPSSTVEQGEGVWINMSAPLTWSLDGARDVDGVLVPLHEGWTLVGYPLWIGGNFAGLCVDQAGSRLSYEDAVAAGLVAGYAFDYDAATGGDTPVTTLEPWHGYWFAGYVSGLSLWFEQGNMASVEAGVGIVTGASVAGTTVAGVMGQQSAVAKMDDVVWQLTVGLLDDTGGSPDEASGTITLGVLEGATDGFDAAWDLPVPPLPPGAEARTSLTLYHPEWDLDTGENFQVDFVAPAEELRYWTAQVRRPEPGVVRLVWDNQILPDDLELELYLPDQDSVVVRSMLEETVVELEIGEEPVLIVFRNPVPSEEIPEPYTGLHLHNVPNPFNPGTEFQFDLPRQGEVEIRIYSLRGERVRTVRGGVMTEGPETLRWEGRNDSGGAVASGAYIYRLYLDGNIEGGSRKMSLIR